MRRVTLPAGRLAAPGVIEVDGEGPTWIGPFEPKAASRAEVERLAELLNASGMATQGLPTRAGPSGPSCYSTAPPIRCAR
jgi:hypothetical protein